VKLVASLVVRNEFDRFLRPCVESLLGFCDELRVLDDGSSDQSFGWLLEQEGVFALRQDESTFYEHEGRTRQTLLDWTLLGQPTHVLAIDADEFVADGQYLRQLISRNPGEHVWTLRMEEVWQATPGTLTIRTDGGWRQHPVPVLWRNTGSQQRINPRPLACGREPISVSRFAQAGKATRTNTEILHFGWANQEHRQIRYDRYMEHDQGQFHASTHLKSIMFPDARCRLEPREWPAGLADVKDQILEVSGRRQPVG
jgi:hypothetical protein